MYGAYWAWHRNTRTGKVTTYDGRRKVGKLNTTTPSVSLDSAVGAATRLTKSAARAVTRRRLMVLPPSRQTGAARLVWAISSADGRGARTSYVDASNGLVLKTVVDAEKARAGTKLVRGTARVFDPNPVVKLQDESLRDRRDSATAVPSSGYSKRYLHRLRAGRHTLVGRWARIMNSDRATSRTNTYAFNRANPYFEQTNAYYSVDSEQAYLQRLGFAAANAESQKVKTNAFRDDNSYYDPSTDTISLGRGGVDDAEDPEVIWHEYGHAIQDAQVPDWGLTEQGGAMGEGFGDYMAVTMSQGTARNGSRRTPTACVMDWDATSYTSGPTHCLRRTDRNKMYPGDMVGEVHSDGEIWSRALWRMNQALGRDVATTIIIESHFWMNQRTQFTEAARTIVNIARELYPRDSRPAKIAHRSLQNRGILPRSR